VNNIVNLKDFTAANPLAELQKRFALITVGGQIGIVDTDELNFRDDSLIAPPLKIYSRGDGMLLMERHLETILSDSNSKAILRNFLMDPNTKTFNRVAFSPLKMPDDVLNLWIDPKYEPIEGAYPTIEEFLKLVISNGSNETYNYLLNYLAHAIQRPHEKPGVMIAMLGGQGTGKGSAFYLIRSIFKHTTVQLNQVNHVVTGFNAILERAYIVLLDEALFAGDVKSTEAMKSLITEPVITIEEKRQPRRAIESYHRFFAATNSTHFAKTDKDDRRMFYLKVADTRVNDSDYWSSLRAAINGSELNAFVYELCNRDISKFNPRLRPEVEELIDQKLMSLQGLERYIFEILSTEKIDLQDWREGEFLSSEYLKGSYEGYSKGISKYSIVQSREISSVIKRILPDLTKTRQNYNGRSCRGYIFCSIDAARSNFEKYIKGKIDWS
jgi:hypothetical protein